MALTLADIAFRHSTFIRAQLKHMEHALQPSSVEDEELVRRAVFSVRNKAVLFERYNAERAQLLIVVQDVRPAEVTVQLAQETIHCTCPQTTVCRHQLGVILSLYQYLDSVQEWASKWRAQKNVHLQALATERSPENWLQIVEEIVRHALPSGQRIESYMLATTTENIQTKIQRYLPLEREWQALFKVFMEVAVLNKLWQHLNDTQSKINNFHFEAFMRQRTDRIDHYVVELRARTRLFATDPFYDALQEQVRLLLTHDGQEMVRFELYAQFWLGVFQDKARMQEELKQLEQMENLTPPLAVCGTFFALLLKDEQLLALALEQFTPAYSQFYLLIAEASGEACPALLYKMLPHLKHFIETELVAHERVKFIKNAQKLYREMALSDEDAAMLYQSFGHHGVQPYAEFLLLNDRYDEWVALQQMFPSSIAYLEARGLKIVAKNAPEKLLPLYHFYAQQELRQKSRQHYKQAIRIWRSMKTAAKRAGKSTYFTNYMETVRKQYKRLRALQEELDKSNLL